MTEPPTEVSVMSPRPMRRRLQARIMRIVNVPVRAVLGLPFPTPLGGRLMLVTHVGRRTGRTYRQPVSYVRHHETLLTPGGGRWTDNLVNGQPVPVRLNGRDLRARPELIDDLNEVDRLLTVMADANPRVRAFVGVPRSADGRWDRDRLSTAVEHGFRVVRWHPEQP